jgi:hypothetical protein
MEIIRALLMGAIPVAIITFVLVFWAGHKGYIIKKDSDSLDDEIENTLDDILQDNPANKKKHIVLDKWMTFGGGYYGVMAFITYIHVELLDLWQAFANFESFQQLLDALSFGFLLGLFMEAIKNLITAFTWFLYWDEIITINNGWFWLVLTYIGYSIGEKLAEHRLQQLINRIQ